MSIKQDIPIEGEILVSSELSILSASLNSRLGQLLSEMKTLSRLGPNARASFLDTSSVRAELATRQVLIPKLVELENLAVSFTGDFTVEFPRIMEQFDQVSKLVLGVGECYLYVDQLRSKFRRHCVELLIKENLPQLSEDVWLNLVTQLGFTLSSIDETELGVLVEKLSTLPSDNFMRIAAANELFERFINIEIGLGTGRLDPFPDWWLIPAREVSLVDPALLIKVWSKFLFKPGAILLTDAIEEYLAINQRNTDFPITDIREILQVKANYRKLQAICLSSLLIEHFDRIELELNQALAKNTDENPLIAEMFQLVFEDFYKRFLALAIKSTPRELTGMSEKFNLYIVTQLPLLSESESNEMTLKLRLVHVYRLIDSLKSTREGSLIILSEQLDDLKILHKYYEECWGQMSWEDRESVKGVTVSTVSNLLKFILSTAKSKDTNLKLQAYQILIDPELLNIVHRCLNSFEVEVAALFGFNKASNLTTLLDEVILKRVESVEIWLQDLRRQLLVMLIKQVESNTVGANQLSTIVREYKLNIIKQSYPAIYPALRFLREHWKKLTNETAVHLGKTLIYRISQTDFPIIETLVSTIIDEKRLNNLWQELLKNYIDSDLDMNAAWEFYVTDLLNDYVTLLSTMEGVIAFRNKGE